VVTVSEELSGGYDVVVVGGGVAGLSGALVLARSRRRVAVVAAGAVGRAPAGAAHGLLGLDGTVAGELLGRARAVVRSYGGQVVRGEVAGVAADGGGFTVALADGRTTRARRLLVSTGLADELPAIPGVRERWGRDVLHCPYCHGWELRDRAVGVLACGPAGVAQALLYRQWSADVVLLTDRWPAPGDAEAEQLTARGIPVVTGEVAALEVVGGGLTGVRLASGRLVRRDVLAVAARKAARVGFLAGLGLLAVEHPEGLGTYLPCDAAGRTELPGVWAAGSVTDLAADAGAAAAAGAGAAADINADLVAEEARAAVAVFRAPFSGGMEARVCALVLGDRRHGF
jgi:thioredoxin reductase